MEFIENSFYHIYNRGNNRQPIFFQERNYPYFLGKIKKYIVPNSNLLAWCLMPNHFHLLIQANNDTIRIMKNRTFEMNALTDGVRLMLSSYTKGIHEQEGSCGNLLQQKTKHKCVDNYLLTAFHYIHQNPLRARLVNKLEDYTWSSLPEYLNQTKRKICKQEIAFQFMDIQRENLLKDTYRSLPNEYIKMIELGMDEE